MKRSALLVSLLAAPAAAFAAVPANVTTALGEGLTDAGAVAALALIIVVSIAVFKYMRRAI
jgi:hypothetical protein